MASIVGEWKNATSADVAALDAQIALHQETLSRAKTLLAQCLSGIAANPFYSCHNRLGASKSNLQETIAAESAAVSNLIKQREAMVASIEQTTQLAGKESEAALSQAEAEKAVAEAGAATATTRGKQFAIYGVIAAAVIVGGIIVIKTFKKK